MNVYVYSEDKLLLLSLADAIRKTGDTPFLVPDFQTLQSLIRMTDPDIAFVDEALFPKEKIRKLQNHIFDVLLDFPITSITDPYFTDYRGKVSEAKYHAPDFYRRERRTVLERRRAYGFHCVRDDNFFKRKAAVEC